MDGLREVHDKIKDVREARNNEVDCGHDVGILVVLGSMME